jgi:ABC-type transport system involved in multi-copper enzyme maturation permease subunit
LESVVTPQPVAPPFGIRSLRRIGAIARLTATEGLRQPSFFLLLFVTGGLIAFSPLFSFFHLGEEAKMVTDLGLSTVLTFSTLLALLTASSTVTDEIEGRTALTMLSKPLRREEFLIGKYVGVAITACVMTAAMAPVLLVTLRSQNVLNMLDTYFVPALAISVLAGVAVFAILMVSRLMFSRGPALIHSFWLSYLLATICIFSILYVKSVPQVAWDWRLLIGIFFICLHACVVSAMAVALATRCSLVQAFIGTSAFFIAGHASGALVAPFRDGAHHLSFLGSIIRALLPDLDQFNITDALATAFMDKPVSIPVDVIVGSTLYALCYGTALLALAVVLFRKRELG